MSGGLSIVHGVKQLSACKFVAKQNATQNSKYYVKYHVKN